MAEFLTSQLDYVFFVYGLALVLLGAVAISIPRVAPTRLPWAWLAAFALLHGLVEWLHLADMEGEAIPVLGMGVEVLLLGSYAALFEFARRAHARIRGSGPGPWLTGVVVALPVALALVRGSPNLGPATRLLVGLPASLWTAAVLASAARRAADEETGSAPALASASLCFAAYGIAAGVLVPSAPFIPGGWPTSDAFLAATGVPVQIVRAAAVGGAALGAWAFAISLDTQGKVLRKRWRFFWLAAVTLAIVLAGGGIFTDQLGRRHDRLLAKDTARIAALVQDHLAMEMNATTTAARVAARMVSRFDLATALGQGGSSRLDDVVDAIGGAGEGIVVYLIDPAGTTVAASNRGQPDSFLGKSYAQRPYFRDAMAGATGRFIGLGMTSRKPGFYASEPVRDASGTIVGAAVVKHLLSAESFGPAGSGSSFLVGADGEVLVASTESMRGRRMWASAPPAAVVLSLPGTDWTVVTLRKESLRGLDRLVGILVSLLLCTVIVAAFVILQRQLGTESRLSRKHREAEGRAREMARKADTDVLTGIANRQGFNEAMAREFARARRFRHPLAVVILDLDHFKRVNDRYGHQVGDQVLAGAARMLATRVRESDFVARWGGEEFAVIASMTDAAGAARLAEKLRALLEVTPLGPAGALTASFGVAEVRPDDTVESLVRRADEVLYEAKVGGRNQVRCAEAWVDMEVIAAAESLGKDRTPNDGKRVYMDTGYAPIDVEHRELSEALDEFVLLVQGAEAEKLRPALSNLIAAVADHFAHEEALMRKRAYPSRARHEEAHMLFVADARRFQVDLEQSGPTAGFRQWAETRLPEWFRYHILAHDVALGKFLLCAPARVQPIGRQRKEVEA